MQLLDTKKELQAQLSIIFSKSKSVGLVPTMGALHQGHIDLIKKAFKENDEVVVSIFVNPTQFNNREDLSKYPKNLTKDIALIAKVSDKIIVYAPSVEEIYHNKVEAEKYNFNGLDTVMEGEFRAGHFDGVGTIVEALLRSIKPNKAYFGEKDYQQLQIVKKLVKNKQIPVEIIGCPIVREKNGLAMSSRNERLSNEVRQKASLIFETLNTAKEKFGTKSALEVTNWVKNQFDARDHFRLEYFQIADIETLKPIKRKIKSKQYRAFIAVFADDIRLIDNIAL
jgi:pantoate--beta-alanine ligase